MDLIAVLFTFSVLLTVSWATPTGGDKEPPKGTPTKNATEQPPPPPEPQGDKFNEFDWRLCKALGETERGNIVISPISLKLVLAMIFEGADGKTAEELASALGLSRENMGRQLTRKKFSSIVNNLKSSAGEYDLNLGTSIFVDKSVTPKPAYVRKLQSFYDAQIEQVDFGQTEEAVKAINAWAAAATKGQIKNLLSNADASSSTVLMLLNAIYFKGTWMYTFPLNQTAPSTFYADGKTAVSANFMNSATYLSYLDAPEINSQIVRLPYVGKKFAMYIIVPNNKTGLPTLIRQINPFVLKKHTQNMYETLVELSLPTFKIDYMANLGSILQELGIKRLFSMNAELNDIAEVLNNSIYVSNVLQKAGIEVNEEGSTAFAATEAQVANKFGDSPVIKLKVDHPFLFFIKDEETETVLFVGSLVNPNSDQTVKPDSITLSPPVTEKSQPTAPTKPETTTSKPENTTNKGNDIQRFVELYFLKEELSVDMKNLIRFHYLAGTTSYDLEETIELYILVKATTQDLEKLIEFYFTLGVSVDELQKLIKFYFLTEITSEDLEKFLKLYFAKGNTSKDIQTLTKFFATKGTTPEVVEKLIRFYQFNKKEF